MRRLVASVWMAGRQNGSTEAQCGDAVARCVCAYRDHLANLAEQPLLERAYERVDLDRLRGAATDPATLHEIERAARRARRKTSDRALPRFTEGGVDGDRRIVADPPLITRPDDDAVRAARRVPRRLPAHGAHPVGAGARRLPGGRHRAQGRRGRIGRAARLPRALRGQQRGRRAVPAAQAGPPIGGGPVRARRPGLARPPGPARRGVPEGAADGLRPAARLDHRRRPAVLRPPVPRHEGRSGRRRPRRGRAGRLRGGVRAAAGQGPRPHQRRVDDRGLPGTLGQGGRSRCAGSRAATPTRPSATTPRCWTRSAAASFRPSPGV